jgi:YidC/Oxa1 family membrane protein insertase
MDKKNTTIGVLLLIGAFAGMIWFRPKPTPPPAAPAAIATQPAVEGTAPAASGTGQPATAAQAPAITPPVANGFYLYPTSLPPEAKIVTLTNGTITVALSDFGGAIRDVAFLKHPAVKGEPAPYLFNAVHAAPMLAFTGVPGLDSAAKWELVEQATDHVTFRAVADGKLEVTRTFTLPQPGQAGDPYRIQVATTLRNVSSDAIGAQRLSFNLGTATLVDKNDTGMYLNAALWNGEDMTYVARTDLEGGGFFKRMFGGDVSPKPYLEKPGKVVWGAVKNQFFAAIFTPDQPGSGLVVRRVKVQPALPDVPTAFGITSDLNVDLPRLEPGASATLGGKFYVGPKEYARLKTFDQGEHHAMQFDGYFFNRIFFAGFFAPLLLTLLNWFHGFLGNWGWAIIVTTLLLKTVTLPLTLSAAKSSKRMAKIQPRLKEINEKYSDNPQKKQKATMELFKEAKVNPVGGCLPILITMPFFIGFFAMLQSSSDLRFAEFLWIKDLASPDTVTHLFGIPLNVMPILMGISSIVQMQLMPTPSVDNSQAKMMKFMPLMFVLFCYNFGSGLALYWTISNLFTIGQQLIINRMPDHDPLPASAAGGVKNVTPAGKRPKQK